MPTRGTRKIPEHSSPVVNATWWRSPHIAKGDLRFGGITRMGENVCVEKTQPSKKMAYWF